MRAFITSLLLTLSALIGFNVDDSITRNTPSATPIETVTGNSEPDVMPLYATDEMESDWSDLVESITSDQTLPGLVVPRSRVPVRASVAGILSELRVAIGSSTVASQVIAVIDDSEIASRIDAQTERIAAMENLVAQAEAELDYARQSYGMYRRLNEQAVVSTAQMLESRYRLDSSVPHVREINHEVSKLEHELTAMSKIRSKHMIVAPITGTVTDVLGFLHQYVAEGDVLFWLEADELEIKVHLPGTLIKERDNLRFSIFADTQWHELKIVRWQPRINADGSQTWLLEMPRKLGFLPGQIVKTHVQAEAQP